MKKCCTPSRSPEKTTGTETDDALRSIPSTDAPAVEWAEVPGGRVLVGTETPLLADDGEGPLRTRTQAPFQMATTTVTNAEFAVFAEATGYRTDAERLGDSLVFAGLLPEGAPPTRAVQEVPWWRQVPGASWRRPFGPDGAEPDPDHPVVHVSWNDAKAFADWAGARLPRESEWEHAARGGLGDVRFPWGNDEPDDEGFQPCNIWQGRFPVEDLGLDGYRGTAPARSFEPNGYGLFNMVGNVWEWTSEPFKVRSLKSSVKAAHGNKGGYKLCKGGSFLCHRSYCYRYRIAARNSSSPDTSTSHIGMRLVREMASP